MLCCHSLHVFNFIAYYSYIRRDRGYLQKILVSSGMAQMTGSDYPGANVWTPHATVSVLDNSKTLRKSVEHGSCDVVCVVECAADTML